MYGDGGHGASPAVFALSCDGDARDVLLVWRDPLEREGTPRKGEGIEARIAELAFSAHFVREMRMFARSTAPARPNIPIRCR